MKTVALILAAGSGKRFGADSPKQFLKLAGRPLLAHTIQRFEDTAEVDEIFVVVAEEYLDFTRRRIVEMYCFGKVSRMIVGGATRAASTVNALAEICNDVDLIAVHDGARPLVAPSDISRVILTAKEFEAAVLVTPVSATIKRVEKDKIVATVDRQQLFAATTPQVFERDLLLQAHESFPALERATDDSFVVERYGVQPRVVIAEHPNPKVTTQMDLELARVLLKNEAQLSEAVGKER